MGCSITIGTANSYSIDKYTHPTGVSTSLDDASSLVTGKAYNGQAPDLIEESDAHKWKAGTTHVPQTAPASTTVGNTNQACYMYEELPKIGRNPSDFGKTLNIKIGARIYSSTSATSFDAVPATSSTVTKASLAAVNYQAAVVVAAAPVVVPTPVVVAPVAPTPVAPVAPAPPSHGTP
jgi:hypothetical protein